MILSCKRDVDKKNPVDTLKNDKWPKGGKTHSRRQKELNRDHPGPPVAVGCRVPSIYLGRSRIQQEQSKRDGY